jgi:hypothetical protein
MQKFATTLGLLLIMTLPALSQDITPSVTFASPAESANPVKLAVLIVFDQLRGDYLTRWQDLFVGGFHDLQTEGAWFTNCHYPYAGTVTAAGHTSVVAGCNPAVHGIIANQWCDRDKLKGDGGRGEYVKAIEFGKYRKVVPGASPPEEPGNGGSLSVSPERLLVSTIGDALKDATGGKARVVSLSLKDRSAVLMGGHRADAVFWMDETTGLFVTSSYYEKTDHLWVGKFNAQRPAEKLFGKTWERMGSQVDYTYRSGSTDDAEGEGDTRIGFGRVFPHIIDGGLVRTNGQFFLNDSRQRDGRLFYDAVAASPFGNDLLLDLVARAIDELPLGRNEHHVPDLLCVSFSSNDLAGHAFGPDSHEVLDITLRSDGLMRKLLRHLDEKVGKNQYLVAVTADHGVCPLPSVSKEGKGHYIPSGTGTGHGAPPAPALPEQPTWIPSKMVVEKVEEVLNDLYKSESAKFRKPGDKWLLVAPRKTSGSIWTTRSSTATSCASRPSGRCLHAAWTKCRAS